MTMEFGTSNKSLSGWSSRGCVRMWDFPEVQTIEMHPGAVTVQHHL